MGAVAAGLILGTAAKLAMALRQRWRWLSFGVLAFVAAGLLRWPIVWTLLTAVPVAVGLAWWVEGRGPDQTDPPRQRPSDRRS
jgi:chromate transporter